MSCTALSPRSRHMPPTRVLALGFFAVITTGTLLLMLPVAAVSGRSVGFLTAWFTATSCTCVTGLTVVEAGVVFSTFGHVVMLLLIQIGGLGFMTAAALLFMALGKRITLRERMTIAEGLNENGIGGQVRLVRRVCLTTLCIETAGTVLLSFKFVPVYGAVKGIWFALFHTVSAFCNAGFDIFGKGDSIVSFSGSPYFLLVVASLIVLGGLGFTVLADVWKKRRFSALTLHSKIVLITTLTLILGGTLLFMLNEYNNPQTIGNMSFLDKITNSFFQSVTLRTAGFASLKQGLLTNGSLLLCILLMFIGASPASTGGGIKTTTAFAMVMQIVSVARGRNDIEFSGRKLPPGTGRKAFAIVFIAFGLLIAMIMVVCYAELGKGISATEIVYECVSAFGTVGTSMGVTAALTPVSKIVLILGMFCGRVGPITLVVAFSRRNGSDAKAQYPEENIMVG